jgi:GR25 family glycosyltransferase involved in LPS biosynthesis
MPLKGFYINLDRSTDRRQQVEAELEKVSALGNYHRFPAIDGHDSSVRPDLKNRAEVGCFASHLEVIRNSNAPGQWLHILEDDVVISTLADVAISALINGQMFDQYDIIFTNIMPSMSAILGKQFSNTFDSCVTTTASGEVTSLNSISAISLSGADFGLTTSYLINPRAVQRVISLLGIWLNTNPFVPIDIVYSQLARAGQLSIACSVPFFTIPRSGDTSTIRAGVEPWKMAHLVLETALFADRNIAQLRSQLREVPQAPTGSVTRDLIAEAYRCVLNSA